MARELDEKPLKPEPRLPGWVELRTLFTVVHRAGMKPC